MHNTGPVDPQHAIIPAGLALEAEVWRAGQGTVIAMTPRRSLGVRGSDTDTEYYGGYLVAESCGERDARLMAASPRLLRAMRLCAAELFELKGMTPTVAEASKAYTYAIEGR